jgi:FixJ family two-component response regulator
MEQHQRVRELGDVAYPAKNRLFLANGTVPGQSGLDLQRAFAAGTGRFRIIFMTGRGNIPTSV